ncbi:MAG: hypothetical protein V1846_03340 [Candidatus Komeilibacteria bacterium]
MKIHDLNQDKSFPARELQLIVRASEVLSGDDSRTITWKLRDSLNFLFRAGMTESVVEITGSVQGVTIIYHHSGSNHSRIFSPEEIWDIKSIPPEARHAIG